MKILVFQQNNSGEKKIAGIRRYGGNRYDLEIIAIDDTLPPVLDDARDYLPVKFEADLVLDFLTHPDLSYDLAQICSEKGIPVIASGKKHHVRHVITPPT